MGPDGNPAVGFGSNAFSYLGLGFRSGSAEIYSIFILFDIKKKCIKCIKKTTPQSLAVFVSTL